MRSRPPFHRSPQNVSSPIWRPDRRPLLFSVVFAMGMIGLSFGAPIDDAKKEIEAGAPRRALGILVEDVQGGSPVTRAMMDMAALAISEAKVNIGQLTGQKEYQEAYQEVLALFEEITGPKTAAAQNLLGGIGPYKIQFHALSELGKDALLPLARQCLADGQFDLAHSYADKAILNKEELNAEARKLICEIYVIEGKLDEASRELEEFASHVNIVNGDANWVWISDARKQIESIRSAGAPSPPVPPAPTPTGGAPVVSQLPAPPAPPAPVSPVSSATSIIDLLKNKEFKIAGREAWNLVVRIAANGDYLPWLMGIPAVFILYWLIWIKAIKMMARRGNFRASLWERRVKWGGFLAFLAFVLTGFKLKPRAAKGKGCPHCKKPIGRIEDYVALNFEACPHCNKQIASEFSLQDYVKHYSSTVEKMLAHRSNTGAADSPAERDAMSNLMRATMTLAVRGRATDLHIEKRMDGLTARIRCDGVLSELINFNNTVGNALLNAFMIQARLDITQHAIPQDGKFNVWIDQAEIDIRINSAPGPHGQNLTMRLLDRRRIMIDSSKLGLEGRNLDLYERTIRRPHGLVLVTGPSGSGKSTTLYVALSSINTGDRSIITLEDPIEYQVPGLKQMQVNVAQHFTFASGMRSILRQDPDVIMVGEVRDKETAEIALDAAMTGHLVFTTLHTIDAATAITRLNDLGIQPRRYTAALELVIAQRLIRINCAECKKPYKPSQGEMGQLEIVPSKDQQFFRGKGCDVCNQTGYFGRTAIFEILQPTEDLKEILEANASPSHIRDLARRNGMKTLREEGVLRILHGKTTLEEVIRVTT